MDEQKDQSKQQATPGATGKSKFPPESIAGVPFSLFILIIVSSLLCVGAIGTVVSLKLMYHKPVMTEQTEVESLVALELKKKKEEEIYYYKSPALTLNLLDGESGKNHYAIIEVHIECQNEETMKELEKKKSMVQDTLITTFQKKQLVELTSIRGKLLLKTELLTQINSNIKTGRALNIFFIKYIVQ